MRFKDTKLGVTHEYETVEKLPNGFKVWNIGNNMPEGYVALCEEVDKYTVNAETLKAIALEESEIKILKEATSYGVDDLKSARRASRLNPKTRRAAHKKELAIATLPIFERISE